MFSFATVERKKSIFNRLSVASIGAYFKQRSIKQQMYNLDLEELQRDVMNHRPKSIEELEKITKFSKREIKIMYRGFKQECPNGFLDESKFIQIYKPFFPQGNVEHYASHVYRNMFRKYESPVTFDRLLLELSTLSHGSEIEKVEWTFDLYDVHKNGFITKKDFIDVVFAIYQLLGERTNPPVTKGSMVEHANEIFQKFDKDNDSEISLEEFKEVYLNDELFLKNIQFLSTRL